jgi:hypothetical protein
MQINSWPHNGKARGCYPMFNAAKPLLFGCGEQFAIAHDASCGIRVVGIDPED